MEPAPHVSELQRQLVGSAENGTQETRAVQVGVTDRVNAEIVSGLSEGEAVVVGMEAAGDAPKAGKGNGRGGGQARGPVLFGG